MKYLPTSQKFNSQTQLQNLVNRATSKVIILNNAKKLNKPGNNLRTFEESVALAASINYYLNRLGLKALSSTNSFNYKEFYHFSTIGDSLVNQQLMNYSQKDFSLLSSNKWMKHTLVKIGFFEMLDNGDHISGTLFEMLVYFSFSQKNKEVFNFLINKLTEGFKESKLKENFIN